MGLPSGDVTFVFSDIEGSTRLLKRLGDRYDAIHERHAELLRHAWRSHDGHEVHTEGDSFFVAFTNPADAIAACAEGQRLLSAEPWPDDGVVRVRMGIHSGLGLPAERRLPRRCCEPRQTRLRRGPRRPGARGRGVRRGRRGRTGCQPCAGRKIPNPRLRQPGPALPAARPVRGSLDHGGAGNTGRGPQPGPAGDLVHWTRR